MPKGHSYKAKIGIRLRSWCGCPICANRVVLKGYNDLATCYPEVASEWHPTKNDCKPDEVPYG